MANKEAALIGVPMGGSWHDGELCHGEEPALFSSACAGRMSRLRAADRRMAEIALS
jgi:hypothetical protein